VSVPPDSGPTATPPGSGSPQGPTLATADSGPPSQADLATIEAIAALLVVAGVTVTALGAQLVKLLATKVSAAAIRLTLKAMTSVKITPPPRSPTSATDYNTEAEPLYRAAFILNSARRVERATKAGRSQAEIIAAERRHYLLHLQAAAKRQAAAAATDRAARRYGRKIGWYAVLDRITSPECRAAHGTNFDLDKRPSIGYPGSVHPHCRCKPGKPWPNGKSTDVATRRYTRRAI